MARVVLINVGLFLMPFALWVLYNLARTRGRAEDLMSRVPVAPLIVAGCALVAISLAVLATLSPGNSDGKYHPATIKDGKIVPGEITK